MYVYLIIIYFAIINAQNKHTLSKYLSDKQWYTEYVGR